MRKYIRKGDLLRPATVFWLRERDIPARIVFDLIHRSPQPPPEPKPPEFIFTCRRLA